MALFLLTRIDDVDWDQYDAKLIRSTTEEDARNLANMTPGDEGDIWGDCKKVQCEIISEIGESKEIISSFNAG